MIKNQPAKRYIVNVEPSPEDKRDFLVGSIYTTPVVLPDTLDYRDELPPVRDQGRQGSCSAQTAACMKEWQERQDVGFTEHFSPQFIYNLRENAGTYGMYPRDTMKILSNEGIVPEKDYPYGSMYEISEELKERARKYTIMGYARIYSIADLKKSLVANGPCYAAFPVKSWGMEFWKAIPGEPEVNYGGHAVSVVGYTKDAFIIRNSWGEDWGDKGYTYYKFADWGMHWEFWTTIDADSNPAPPPPPEPEPIPEPEPEVEPTPDPEPQPEPTPVPDEDAEKKKKDLEDDLKKKANKRLKWWQKVFFCLNEKV